MPRDQGLDEFVALVDTNGRRIFDLPADPLQCLSDILVLVTEASIYQWRKARDGINNRQNFGLATLGRLVLNEVQRLDMVGAGRLRAVARTFISQTEADAFDKAV